MTRLLKGCDRYCLGVLKTEQTRIARACSGTEPSPHLDPRREPVVILSCCAGVWELSVESYEPLPDVISVGVHRFYLSEQVASSGQFPGPLIKIGQGVPLPQVRHFRPRTAKRTLQQFYRASQVALVG
jgi:hypothetical protein